MPPRKASTATRAAATVAVPDTPQEAPTAEPARRNGARPAKVAAAPRRPAARPALKRTAAAAQRDGAGGRRNDIIRAAAETFYRKGYNATTTQDIAEEVGMLKGSLYYYITAKEDMLFEIIDEVHELLAKNLDVVAAMEGDPLARIWALVYRNVTGNAKNLINSAVFFRDFSALTGRRRKHILALRDKGDTMLRELIHDGQVAGLVRADVDAKVAATGINTMCNALYHWYKPDGELTPDVVARSYADLAVGGLTANAKLLDKARKAALAS